jgi:hypothetical protein
MLALLTVSISGCGQTEPDFSVESKFPWTFSPTDPLSVGQKIGIEVITKAELTNYRETIQAYKCGPKCNTAKPITQWGIGDLKLGKRIEFDIKENGQYYFWLSKENNKGEIGPVKILSVDSKEKTYIAVFESGTKIKIWYIAQVSSTGQTQKAGFKKKT